MPNLRTSVSHPTHPTSFPPTLPPAPQSDEYLRAHAKAHAPELLLAMDEGKLQAAGGGGGSGGRR